MDGMHYVDAVSVASMVWTMCIVSYPVSSGA